MAETARPWRDDGKRFVASLQDVTDPQCYKDFFESDKLAEAKEKADEAAEKYQRSVIIFDREQCETPYRKIIEREKKEEKKFIPAPPRRGKRKAEPKIERKGEMPKKKTTKDDYFE